LHDEEEERGSFATPLSYSNLADGHRSFCIADADDELHCSSCVQADHDVDEVVREAKFLQHLEESLARDGVEGFDKLRLMKSAHVSRLCSLRFSSAIYTRVEEPVDSPSLSSKTVLVLQTFFILHELHGCNNHGGENLGSDVQKTDGAPVLAQG
jgi:hypothetical protein